MGCSPSKGQRFTGALEPSSSARGLLHEDLEDYQPIGEKSAGNGDSTCQLNEETKSPVTFQEKRPSLVELTPVSPDGVEKPQEGGDGMIEQRGNQLNTTVEDQQENTEEGRLRKSKAGLALCKADIRDIELPQANPGADGHISPSLSKYEALKNLLDQVTQTHRSLQPMAALMALRCEEINRELEDMAEEGERMLREHGKDLTKSQPADQLQQMVQYTSEKTRLGDDSAGGLGDSALEDAVAYFATLSTLLDERLRAKRAAEQRLAQVLARVGAMGPRRKHAPEDGSLHSEDSGIGVESESLNGFERPQRHGDSSELNRFEYHRRNQSVSINSKCSNVDDGRSSTRAKRAASLGNDAPLWLKQGTEQRPEILQMVTSTGTKMSGPVLGVLRRSWSVGSLCHQTVGTTQPQQGHHHQISGIKGEAVGREAVGTSVCCQLNRKFEQDGQQPQEPLPLACSSSQKKTSRQGRTYLRRHSSGELEVGEKEKTGDLEGKTKDSKGGREAVRVTPPPRPRPSPAQLTPESYRNSSVRRLINTFSCRENSNNSNPTNVPVLSRGARKYGAAIKLGKSGGTISSYCQMGSRTHIKAEDSDVDPLPPPPPEVLWDNSFSQPDRSLDGEGKDGMPSSASAATQRLHSSQLKGTSPSSSCTLHLRSSSCEPCASPASPVYQDTALWARPDSSQESERHPKKEEADVLYHQDHKIIHLQDSTESSMNTVQAGQEPKMPSFLEPGVGSQGGSGGHSSGDTTVLPLIRQPGTTISITPTSSAQNFKLPRTLVVSQQAVGSPEGGSSGPVHLPPLPSGQTGLISLTSSQQSIPSVGWNQEVSREGRRAPVPGQSMSFQDEAQRETWITSQSTTLPRPWGESPRNRLPLSACSPQPFVRRCHSDRRPGGSGLARMSLTAVSKANQSQSRESAFGSENRPIREEELCDPQHTLRDSNLTPLEHCIMGQAMVSNCKETDEGHNRITD